VSKTLEGIRKQSATFREKDGEIKPTKELRKGTWATLQRDSIPNVKRGNRKRCFHKI